MSLDNFYIISCIRFFSHLTFFTYLADVSQIVCSWLKTGEIFLVKWPNTANKCLHTFHLSHVFVLRICFPDFSQVVCSGLYSWNKFLIFYVWHCFIVEAVIWRNTKGFSCEEVDEIAKKTFVWENSTNCETRVGNFHALTFFLWDSHEMCSQLFYKLSVAGLTSKCVCMKETPT